MKNIFLCVKKRQILAIFAIILIISAHLGLYFSFSNYKDVIKSVNYKIFNSFNREELSQNDSDIFFVASKNIIKLPQKIDKLFLPSQEKYEKNGGVLTFKTKTNFMVKSAGAGIVVKIGMQENGLKFVEIRHTAEITTRYENLSVIGVGENFTLTHESVLGVSSERENFVFKIFTNGEIIENFSVENGEIKWTN